MRINKAKLAAERRASMAAELAAEFIASGAEYRCTANVTRNESLMANADYLARRAVNDGLSFGNSQSRACPYHVASLILYDADRLVSARYYPKAPA